MAMSLYANTFRWLLVKINARIVGKDAFATVGLLDIFGFENFEVRRAVCVCVMSTIIPLFLSKVNRFEQFNINFANEKLQEYFNKHIFSLEQHEYNK